MQSWATVDLSELSIEDGLSISAQEWGLQGLPDDFQLDDGGSTTVGPADSNIVSLSYGISALIALILTLIIMGNHLSSQKPPPEPLDNELPKYYNAPASRNQREAEKAVGERNLTKEVQQCAALLRQMYALDLRIWGMEGCQEEDVPRQLEMKRKSDAIFMEVRRIGMEWESGPSDMWQQEEADWVRKICKAIREQPEKRHT